jgi:hypothetical protein
MGEPRAAHQEGGSLQAFSDKPLFTGVDNPVENYIDVINKEVCVA